MFALVGVHCGPDITVPAAASLAGVPRAEAGRALAELAGASLAAEHRPGRYVLHNLVRSYAAGQARQAVGEAGIRAAIERSLDHYLHTVVVVSPGIPWIFTPAPPAPGVLPEHLASEATLMDWPRAEHQVLLQATAPGPAAAGFITRAWQLFECQAWFLGGQEYWSDWRTVGQVLLAAAGAVGDHTVQGWTHTLIGRYGTFTGADDGRTHMSQALDHFQRAGDPARPGLGTLVRRPGVQLGKAAGLRRSCTVSRPWRCFARLTTGPGRGWPLPGLGNGHAHLGDSDRARDYARRALEVIPETGDPTSLALVWDALGLAHSRLGEHRQAITVTSRRWPLWTRRRLR